MFAVNNNPSRVDLRKFGLAMLVGFSLIGAILYFTPFLRTRDIRPLEWTGNGLQVTALSLLALSVALCLLSFVWPRGARPVYVIWMTVATAIGMVMSTLLLTVLFFVLLPAFSLIVRMGDPLRRRLAKDGTYWASTKPHEPTLERMRRPF